MESGRPHSPLVNAARTRPEAEEFALKNRGTNDWYRHDGKNVESPTPPPLRLEEMHSPRTRPEAQEYAQKNKVTSDWYQHDGKPVESPTPRQHNRPEAQEIADKDKKNAEWYKHDGQPVDSPTPRSSRPETAEIAEKNRGAHDWYQDDGKNETPSPPTRIGNKTAKAIADKYKGDSEEWYGHNNTPNGKVNGHCPEFPRPKKSSGVARCQTPDARRNYNKIKGTDETWYKHEENKNFVSPRPKSRLQGRDATDAKGKSVGSGSEWYKHEHKGSNGYIPPKPKSRITSANASNNATKMRPNGTPVWASYDQNGVDHTDSRPHSRLTGEAVEYHERNKGTAGDWYAQNGTSNGTNGHSEAQSSPRRGSEESQKFAEKQKGGAGNWFNHEANRHYNDPVKPARCQSASARDMIEKTRGHELGRVMNHETDSNHNGIRPEAAEYAQKSVQGMMSKYLQTNGNYESPRPATRIKPEAEQNAARNKGNMGEFMEGYLDTPKKHNVHRVRPEAEDNANRGRGAAASRAMTGDLPGSARKNPRLQGEASKSYADRNLGTKNLIGDFNGLQVSGTPIRHRSAQAAANAARWQGSEMNSIFNHN